MQHFHTPEQFVAYCENRAEDPSALFSLEEIQNMLHLTGKAPSDSFPLNMKYWCLLARFNLAKKAKMNGEKFDDKKFCHLALVKN